jgi:isopentenyl phosphate kinase
VNAPKAKPAPPSDEAAPDGAASSIATSAGGAAPRLLVLKIGGSLVSDKEKGRQLDLDAVDDYARQVAELARAHPGRLALVSGGGAPGHNAVRDPDPDDPYAVLGLTEVTFAVKWAWVSALSRLGVPAMPIQTAALVSESDDGVDLHLGSIGRLLAAGIVPVLSGDCVLTRRGGLRIFGSDEVPAVLVRDEFAPVRVVTLTDVPGVLTSRKPGAPVLRHVDALIPEPAFALLWETASWDTSGAMRGKLDALIAHARRGAECVIARGERGGAGLAHLFEPLDAWPAGLGHTVVARSDPAANCARRPETAACAG